jgi:hypothetical protein
VGRGARGGAKSLAQGDSMIGRSSTVHWVTPHCRQGAERGPSRRFQNCA